MRQDFHHNFIKQAFVRIVFWKCTFATNTVCDVIVHSALILFGLNLLHIYTKLLSQR